MSVGVPVAEYRGPCMVEGWLLLRVVNLPEEIAAWRSFTVILPILFAIRARRDAADLQPHAVGGVGGVVVRIEVAASRFATILRLEHKMAFGKLHEIGIPIALWASRLELFRFALDCYGFRSEFVEHFCAETVVVGLVPFSRLFQIRFQFLNAVPEFERIALMRYDGVAVDVQVQIAAGGANLIVSP